MPPTRRGYLGRAGSLAGILASAALSGCVGEGFGSRTVPTVRVGSKPFAEQEILGTLTYLALQDVEGIQAVDEVGYGNSLDNWEAVIAGTKDVYWEYTGTAWSRLPPRREERITDPQRLYELVAADAREQGLRMAPPASFSNGFVLVADRAWSERTDVRTIDELATHVDGGNTGFGVAVGESFYHRPDAWRSLTDHYGFDDDALMALESSDFIVTSIGLTYELLREGQVQVASGFETDPQLDRPSVVVLEDDRDYFLPYQPAPTAHAPTVEAHPEVFEALEPVVSALDGATIRRLNRRVVLEDRSPLTVARSFLDWLGRPT